MNNKNINIREATNNDIEKIKEFQLNTALETEGMKLDKIIVTKGVQAVFEDPAKGQYYVAEKSGHVVGCVLVIPEWSDWRNGTVLWIHSIYVIPELRRQGVLRSIYSYLQNMVAKSPHLMGLRTLVDKRNVRGIEAAKALGLEGEHYETYEWLKK